MPEDHMDDKDLDRLMRRVDHVLHEDGDAAAPFPRREGRVDGYRLLRRIGQGGMGVVWLAADEELGRQVAIKFLTPHMTYDREAIWRFGQEATATARLSHPGIVAVHAAGEADGLQYIVMDYVEGVPLDRLLARLSRRRPGDVTDADLSAILAAEAPELAEAAPASYVRTAVGWIAEAAEALHHAHTRGVLHRDVKPSNLILDTKGLIRIVDFGLARLEESAPVTRTGAILGTLHYMAPETLRGPSRRIDARADVYSLGAVLYELLTFRPPFISESLLGLMEEVSRHEPARLRKAHPGLSRDLALVAGKALSKGPDHRYATALDFADDLRRFLDGKRVRARPPGPWRRLRSWTRRYPVRATVGLLLLAVLLLSWPVASFLRAARAAEDAAEERGIMEGTLRTFQEVQKLLVKEREQYQALRGSWARSFEEADRAQMAKQERSIREVEVQLATLVDSARGALERAARIEAAHGGVSRRTDDAFARYYLFRYELALLRDDPIERELTRKKVIEHDRSGKFAALLRGSGSLVVSVDPPDAEVYLFRYEEYEAIRKAPPVIPRLVPVPSNGSTLCRPGAWIEGFHPGDPCLVVTEVEPGSPAAAASVVPGDLVVRINGTDCGDGVFVTKVVPGGPMAKRGVTAWDRIRSVGRADLRRLSEWDAIDSDARDTMLTADVRSIIVSGARAETPQKSFGVEVAGVEQVFGVAAPPGGCRILVLRGGDAKEILVRASERSGIVCERTAYPLILGDENRITAGKAVDALPGRYLLCLRRHGYEDQRYSVVVPRGGTGEVPVHLLTEGSTPAGCVWIPPGPCLVGGDPYASEGEPGRPPGEKDTVEVPGFFIRRTELSTRDWFEFLNDPKTRAFIESEQKQGRTVLVPRHYAQHEPLYSVVERSYVPEHAEDSPILGISNEDIGLFLEWRNERARALGEKWRWRRPTIEEWEKAARGADGRVYPWGNRLDWALCLCSHYTGTLRRGAKSRYEIRDESPFGVADMAGSRREWTTKGLKGGSWGDADRRMFRAGYVDGFGGGYYNFTCGFRPVLERRR